MSTSKRDRYRSVKLQWRAVLLVWLLLICCCGQLQAQQHKPAKQALLPVISYSTDTGFGAGGIYQYLQYDHENRVRRLSRIRGNMYLNEGFSFRALKEDLINPGERVTIHIGAEQLKSAYFFGRGKDTEFSDELFNTYSRLTLELLAEYGQRIGESGPASNVELVFGVMAGYLENSDFDGRLLDNHRPQGFRGGFRQAFQLGLRGDFRDDVFRPSAGSLFDVQLGYFPKTLGNDLTIGKLTGLVSVYEQFHLLTDVVFAAQISGEQVLARAPYYELSAVGGELSLRGYVLERFRDYGSLVANLELRTWLFKLPFWEIEIGGQLFSDIGTLYKMPFEPGWASNIKTTAGLGGAVSIFNRDFIIRGDLGFSREHWRFYTGIGYMF